jgi:hypothetical protein
MMSAPGRTGLGDQCLCFGLNLPQMVFTAEALGIDLIHRLGAGRTCREPAMLGNDLQPADGAAITRRLREYGENFFPGQLSDLDLLR